MKDSKIADNNIVEEVINTDVESGLADKLIKNSEELQENNKDNTEEKKRKRSNLMEIRDIIFLSVLSAAIFISGIPMMFVKNVPVFGVIQMTLAVQFSLLLTVGLLKVRKPGAVMFVSVIVGLLHVPMFPPMGVVMIICGGITEALIMAIFRGYKKDIAGIFAGSLWLPLSLPQLFIFYTYMYGGSLLAKRGKGLSGIEVNRFAIENPAVAIALTVAVILLSILGAVYGWIISRELRKAGVFKK